MKLKPRLYFITGISGSGKTTIGRKLVELGEVAFDSKIQKGLFYFADKDGNHPHDYNPSDSEWSDKYKWVLNKPMFDDLLEKNKSVTRVFLCGGADDIKKYWPLGYKVFLLKVDTDTIIQRLNNHSRDNDFGKDHKTQVRLIEKLERFQDKSVNEGAIVIDAKRSVSEIVKDIMDQAI